MSFSSPQTRSRTAGDGNTGSFRASPGLKTKATVNKSRGKSSDTNIKVVVRVRPPLQRELQCNGKPYQQAIFVHPDQRTLTISENLEELDDPNHNERDPFRTSHFAFDYIHHEDSTQEEVYSKTARAAVVSTLEGYNATIMAYGQTGSGKTYTMEGFEREENGQGILPRAIADIFEYINSADHNATKFLVRVSYLQIYNEVISDLLRPEGKNLAIREDVRRGTFVEGLSEWVIRSVEEAHILLRRGNKARATAATKMNELSSRSHVVFTVIVEQQSSVRLKDLQQSGDVWKDNEGEGNSVHSESSIDEEVEQIYKMGKLNLVDLCGSERVRVTGATGTHLEESKKINQSLSALGNVISALIVATQQLTSAHPTVSSTHIPYRDSKLTRLLQDSLGGNCKTTVITTISPAREVFWESLSTLQFAQRAKRVRLNTAAILSSYYNSTSSNNQQVLLRQYASEIHQLRQALEERHAREEVHLHDKMQLEARIAELTQQVIHRRHSPSSKHSVQHSDMISLSESDESRIQLEKYKKLLLKQRDVMIALTNKLAESNETIELLKQRLQLRELPSRSTNGPETVDTAMLKNIYQVNMPSTTRQEPQAFSALKKSQPSVLEEYRLRVAEEELQPRANSSPTRKNNQRNSSKEDVVQKEKRPSLLQKMIEQAEREITTMRSDLEHATFEE